MNNEQKIIETILQEAKDKAKLIIEEAKREADTMLNEAIAISAKENMPIIQKAKSEAKDIIAKEISSAELEARKFILTGKQKVMEETISEAKNKLDNMPEKEYLEILTNIVNSIEYSGDEIILLSIKDQESVKNLFTSKGFSVADEGRDIGRGFIIKDGDVEYNYTFDSIFSVSREQIETTAAQILFSQGV